MKAKILFLILSLLFVSTQFFGQSLTDNEQKSNVDLKSTEAAKEVLRLKLTCDATTYSDEAIVIFNDSDPTQGAAKLMSMYATAPELWSVKNGLKYSISFLGGLDSTIIVPITAKAGLPGNYTIIASQLESFGTNIEISLEDRYAGTFIILGDTPSYTFPVSAAATLANRFFLHFVDKNAIPPKDLTAIQDRDAAQSFKIFATDGTIIITSLQKLSGKITVFDINGRRIATAPVEAGATTRIDMHGNTGVYIVSVLSGKGISNTKIVVR